MRNHHKLTQEDHISDSLNSRCEYTGKIKYRTKQSAERRRRYEYRILGLKDSRTVHHCAHCGAWHITHYRSNKKRITPYNRNKAKDKKWH